MVSFVPVTTATTITMIITVVTQAVIAPLVLLPTPVASWISPPSRRYSPFPSGAVRRTAVTATAPTRTTAAPTALFSTPSDGTGTATGTTDGDVDGRAPPAAAGTGTIYQRTFYRLSSGSQVTIPHALILEERLRFRPDPSRPADGGADGDSYVLPWGPRTLILREGSDQDELTDELFRMDVPGGIVGDFDIDPPPPHDGPRSMDTEIATILYLAANPQWIQGDVLELSCGGGGGTTAASGVVGLLGCVAARLATMDRDEAKAYKQQRRDDADLENSVMTVPRTSASASSNADGGGGPFPKRMHRLTLSDESPEALKGALPLVRRYGSPSRVSLKEVAWNVHRRPASPNRGRHYDHEYRAIIGSDLELSYPTARELARTVANMLLPSNEFAVASIREGADTSPSFGALGMDPEPGPAAASPRSERQEHVVDPAVPPAFIHVCPDRRDDVMYLRQFLERGFRMAVTCGYVKVERLQFVLQTLPEGTSEEALDDLDDLELQEEGSSAYQSLTAVHHPDYAGEGSGEYFFPLETGAYEGGAAAGGSPLLEPEEGGYAM